MKRIYAGIGSRQTPEEVLELFNNIAVYLAIQGFILRSGGANGADSAFEMGCDNKQGEKEIYIPWKNFNNSPSEFVVNNPDAEALARKYHPYFDRLKPGAKKLMARNSCQVLGSNLDTPSDFVICWTPEGKGEGGTGQAIRIAKDYNIPVFDVGGYENIDEFREEFWKWLRINYDLN